MIDLGDGSVVCYDCEAFVVLSKEEKKKKKKERGQLMVFLVMMMVLCMLSRSLNAPI